MSVQWKPLPDGFKVPMADDPMRAGLSDASRKPGTGKRACGHCGYRIRGNESDHEKGYHHQHPRKK